jgi:hypothetical protein
MATLTVEHFAIPTSGRQARRLQDARARAADELGDRTVWWWADGGVHPEDPVCIQDVVVLRERPAPDLMSPFASSARTSSGTSNKGRPSPRAPSTPT